MNFETRIKERIHGYVGLVPMLFVGSSLYCARQRTSLLSIAVMGQRAQVISHSQLVSVVPKVLRCFPSEEKADLELAHNQSGVLRSMVSWLAMLLVHLSRREFDYYGLCSFIEQY